MNPVLLEGKSLPVFPCCWANKKPATEHGFKDATADTKLIEAQWGHYSDFLTGVRTGECSGLAVIDVDPRNGGDAWLGTHKQNLPETRVHATLRGGWHVIFRHPPGLGCSEGRIARGIDVKGEGGYFIWWPAVGGQVYDAPVAEFPAWILETLTKPKLTNLVNAPSLEMDGPPVPGAELPKALYFKVLELVPISANVKGRDQRRVRKLLLAVTEKNSLGSHRNGALNWAAFRFRELIEAGIVSREIAECLLLDAATLNGYVAKDGATAAIATIRSGLGTGTGGPYLSSIEQQGPDEGPG